MKILFPGQYRPSDEDMSLLWKNGTFIFDTNVLLNLYSYPDSVREIFLSVLEKISTRSWIPYQVALEFHRNRFARIKQANGPLLKLRDRIRATSEELESEIKAIEFEKRNTGIDNLEARLRSVNDANSLLAEALDKACDRLPKIGLDDPIAEKLARLFEKQTGTPPLDQAALDAIISDGGDRYEKKIPPGFMDAKEKREIKYYDRGVTYPAMFGDLILWRQSIEHAKKVSCTDVVFITGDRKEDWWNTIDRKTLGPLPELVREFTEESGVKRFWMYTADQFLKYAETYLSANEVTAETIEQVREISVQNKAEERLSAYRNYAVHLEHVFPKSLSDKRTDNFIWSHADYDRATKSGDSRLVAEERFEKWAMAYHGTRNIIRQEFPDLVVRTNDGFTGYEFLHSTGGHLRRMNRRIASIAEKSESVPCDLTIVIIVHDVVDDDALSNYTEELVEMLDVYPIKKIIVGDIFLNEFNVLHILSRPSE